MSHALLSASGSARWLNCPPSAKLEASYPEENSVYAEEGTLAHRLCEAGVNKALHNLDAHEYAAELDSIQKDPLYTPEMFEAASVYVETVMAEIDKACGGVGRDSRVCSVYTEQRVDFSPWVPEGFGTADCLICHPGGYVVVDFKYGKGVPVEASGNPQLKLYALGVLNAQALVWGENPVTCIICQPRLNSITSVTYSYSELMDWGEAVKPIASMAFAGDGTLSMGDWCRFCKHRRNCEAQRAAALSVVAAPKPQDMTPEALAELLSKAPLIKDYIKALEEWALERAKEGEQIPGFKLVEGRSIRKYSDPEVIAAVLKAAGFGSEIYKKPELLGLGDMEKLLSKKRFQELIGSYVIKPEGAPTLVPETDKRPAIQNTAAEAFKEIKL